MKKRKYIILFILVFSIALTGCGRSENVSMHTISSGLLEGIDLNDVNLTIYYYNVHRLTRAPVALERLVGGWYDNTGRLINGWYDYKITISGEVLIEHFDLIERMSNADLIPVKVKSSYTEARMYYLFEKDGQEVLSFLSTGFNRETRTCSIFVNGQEFEPNDVFYEILFLFLPENEVEKIKVYVGWGARN